MPARRVTQRVDERGEQQGESARREQPGQHGEVHARLEVRVDGDDARGEGQGEGREHCEGFRRDIPRATHRPEHGRRHGARCEHDAAHDALAQSGERAGDSRVEQCDRGDDDGDGTEHPPHGALVVAHRGWDWCGTPARGARELQVDDGEECAVLQVAAHGVERYLGTGAVEQRVAAGLEVVPERAQSGTEGVVEGHSGVYSTISAEHHDFAPLGRCQKHASEVPVDFRQALDGLGEMLLSAAEVVELVVVLLEFFVHEIATLDEPAADLLAHRPGLLGVVDAVDDVRLRGALHVDALLEDLPV
jgi:hypothetical protein